MRSLDFSIHLILPAFQRPSGLQHSASTNYATACPGQWTMLCYVQYMLFHSNRKSCYMPSVMWNNCPCFPQSLVCFIKHLSVWDLAVEETSAIPVNCHSVVTITESIDIIDSSVFSGSEPLFHFVNACMKT
jgi:hypothetical protein